MYAKRKEWPLVDVKIELSHQKILATDCEDCDAESGYVDVVDKKLEFVGDLTPEQHERLAEIAERCPMHRTFESCIRIRKVPE